MAANHRLEQEGRNRFGKSRCSRCRARQDPGCIKLEACDAALLTITTDQPPIQGGSSLREKRLFARDFPQCSAEINHSLILRMLNGLHPVRLDSYRVV
jgi:hypothetical protein